MVRRRRTGIGAGPLGQSSRGPSAGVPRAAVVVSLLPLSPSEPALPYLPGSPSELLLLSPSLGLLFKVLSVLLSLAVDGLVCVYRSEGVAGLRGGQPGWAPPKLEGSRSGWVSVPRNWKDLES